MSDTSVAIVIMDALIGSFVALGLASAAVAYYAALWYVEQALQRMSR